jgi:endonuclease-3
MTSAAVKKLQALEGGLTPQNVCKLEESVIGQAIFPVGFWRKKAVFLKKAAAILVEKYDGDIPKTIPELVELPGVGIKMATIAMSVANKIITGIGVDTHVHRIANRLGWVRTMQKTPADTQKALEAWMPREIWGELNLLFVGFGQTLCSAREPQCGSCLNAALCPSSSVRRRLKKEPTT